MADPEGVVLRFRVEGHPEAHDLWWLPDTMLQAMREGHFDPIPASVATEQRWGGMLLHRPTEAFRGHRSDVLRVIEQGWAAVASKRQAVPLADLPFKDAANYPEVPPEKRRNHFSFGGPLTPFTGIPDRPMGKGQLVQQKANLRAMWESIDRWQAAAQAGDPNPPETERLAQEVKA